MIKKTWFGPLKIIHFLWVLLTRAGVNPAEGTSASYAPFCLAFPKMQKQVHGVNLLP